MPVQETLIEAVVNEKAETWQVSIVALGPGGEILGEEHGQGSGPCGFASSYQLLGLALEQGLRLADGIKAATGNAIVIEADTWQNGVLKVTLSDWIREGAFSDGVGGRFGSAGTAWSSVAQRLTPQGSGRAVSVRWKPGLRPLLASDTQRKWSRP